MKQIVSFILMIIISMNYCFSNFSLEIFAQDKDINVSSKQEIEFEEKQQEKEKKDRLKVKLNENLVNLEIGKEHKLDYEIISDSDKKDITEEIIFSTSDENIATVNKDGRIKAIDIGKVFINISIKDSEVIETCEVNIVGDINKVKNTSQEETHDIVLEKEKSYEIINNSKQQIKLSIENTSYKYDKITYSKDGSIYSTYKNNYGNLYISGNSKVKLGIKSDDIKFFVPIGQKDNIEVVEIEGPIIYEGILEAGKTYEIVKNTSNTEYIYSMNGDKVYYDEISYNKDGSISTVNRNLSGNISIYYSCSKVKVELKDKEYKYYMPNESRDDITIKEIEGPIIYEGILEAGKTYEIVKNTSNTEYIYSMNGDKVYYDEISYNKDGSSTVNRNLLGNISIYYSCSKVKVELKDKEYKYYMPSESRDDITIKEIEGPIIYEFNLDKGSTYRIENNSNSNLTIKNNSSSNSNNKILYDYVLYNKDGTYKQGYNSNGNINLGANKYIIISPSEESLEGLNCYIPYEHYKSGISIEKVSYGIGDIIDIMPKVEVNISKVLSKVSTSKEDTTIKDTPNNYTIRVKNKTQNKYISISKIKNNYIILRDNDVNSNDELTIELSSNDTSKVSVDVVLDVNKQASKDISITQLGYIIANYNNTDEYTTRTMIFDENGKYIRDKSFVDNNKVNTGYLDEGKYTLILLKSDGYLWRLNSLSEFNERNLVQGKDYIKYNIDIKNGIINEINLDKIPILDEDRISFLQRDYVIFNTNTNSVSVNGLIEVSLRYNFKDIYTIDDIKNIKMCFDLSKYAELVENSVVLDKNNVKYEITSDRLIIPVNKLKGTIKFFVRPHEGNRINLKSETTFSYNGRNIKEVLGQVKIDSNYITLNEVDKFTNVTSNVHGITLPNTNVSVYQGSKKIGQTTSNSGGRWSARVTLPNAYSGSVHTIYAKINEGKDNEKISNTINIKYSPKSPSIKKVELVYKNKKYDLTRAITDGKQNVIRIGSYDNKFTFIIEVENSEAIKELYVTSTRNDVKKKLKAIYDEASKKWIASGYFDKKDKNYVPRSLSIEYSTNNGILSVGSIDFESKQFIDSLPDNIKNSNVTIIDQDKNGTTAKVELADKDKTTAIVSSSLSNVDKNKYTEDDLLSKGYKNYGNDNWGKYEVTNTGKFLVVEWLNWSTGELYSCVMEAAGQATIGELFTNLDNIRGLASDLQNLRDLSYKYPEQSENIEIFKYLTAFNYLLGTFGGILYTAGSINPFTAGIVTIGGILFGVLSSEFESIMEGKIPLLATLLIDPSGYLYEAVDSNRIEGVTTTVYYQDENGQAVKWNAEEYDQLNPLITDKEGKYAWDVPEGLWQVKYEKEGYETTYSEWLPVPPPQTEVNIGIVSYEKPSIELFNIYEDRAEITFNKYIDISTINTDSIELNDSLGNKISIEIDPFEQEESKDKKVLAKKFILKTNTKNTLSLNNEYTLKVKNTVKTYAGVNNDSDIIAKTTYKPLPTVIKVDDSYELNYGKEINIPISIDNISNSEDFEVTVTSSMNDIVSIVSDKVKFDKDGKTMIKVVGKLPGEAELTFKIGGTDLESKTKVNVLLPNENNQQNTAPTIEAKDMELKVGDEFKVLEGVTAYDKEDGDITNKIEIVENNVNTSKAGVYKVVYKVIDSKGTIATKTITVTVQKKDDENLSGGVIIPTPPQEIEFNDIKGHWAEKTIKEFTYKKFINGYEDNTFKPDNSMTRAEFVKVVNKVFGYSQKGKEYFTDINEKDWFYEDICIGIKVGYIKGKSADIFAPNDNITRQEVAMILTNIMNNKDEYLDKLNAFKDGNKTDKWAQSSVEGAIEAGYLNGYEDKTIRANSNITRAEAISMLSRIKN